MVTRCLIALERNNQEDLLPGFQPISGVSPPVLWLLMMATSLPRGIKCQVSRIPPIPPSTSRNVWITHVADAFALMQARRFNLFLGALFTYG